MTTERAKRIREHLLAQAEQYDLIDLWPGVLAQRSAFLLALEGVTDEQARWRPGTGEGEDAWSIIEVAQHLLGWTRNVGAVIEATAHGRTETKLPPGYLDPDPSATIEETRRTLAEASARFASVVERMPAEPDISTTVPHTIFGPMNCRMWFAMAKLHDGDHTRQVERLKQSEGFPP